MVSPRAVRYLYKTSAEARRCRAADDAKSANSSTYGGGCRRICYFCKEQCSCWNYNSYREVVCEGCADDQYKTMCENECDTLLDEMEHIHILTKGDQEKTWCHECFESLRNQMKAEGWSHDEEEYCPCGWALVEDDKNLGDGTLCEGCYHKASV